MNLSIVFFGTDQFSVAVLERLLVEKVEIKACVTKPDRALRRKKKAFPFVKEYLLEKGVDIPLYQPERASSEDFVELMKEYSPDLFVVVSYGEIISQDLLDVPKIMAINVHPSLLPKYRGPSPLRSAILNGDKEIGVAIIEMVKAMDAGDILKMTSFLVGKKQNHSDVEKKVFEVSGILLMKCMKEIEEGRVKKEKQEGEVSFTKKFGSKDLIIDWDAGVEKVLNLIRAFGDTPGAYTYIDTAKGLVKLKVIRAEKESDEKSAEVKTKYFSKSEGWCISCIDGVIRVLQVQKENKKVMSALDFINGERKSIPEVHKEGLK